MTPSVSILDVMRDPQLFGAVFAAHGFVMTNKRKSEAEQTNLAPLLGVVVSVGLIILGIMAIGRPIFGSS